MPMAAVTGSGELAWLQLKSDHPGWRMERDVPTIPREIHTHNAERWAARR